MVKRRLSYQKSNTDTAKIIDEIIRFGASAAVISSAMVMPQLIIALDKPLHSLYKRLDRRAREREARRIIYYMRSQGYLAGSYKHGLQLTDKARQRLAAAELSDLHITPQPQWDKRWRIIIYDIPESSKAARDSLTNKLRDAGCFQLQKSAWITPFPCRDVVEKICSHFDIDEFVSYIEAFSIDNQEALLRLLRKKYSSTVF